MSFCNSDFFFLGVNDENCSRKTFHIFNAAKVLFELFKFALHQDNFLLRILSSGAFFKHLFQFFQTCNTGLDCAEVGQHAAEPAFIDIELVAACSFFLYRVLSLFLCSYEENRFALCCNIANESISFFNFLYSLLQVDNVDSVAFCEDESCHLRIPTTGLMTKMNACFK